jgi:hypothetical protein
MAGLPADILSFGYEIHSGIVNSFTASFGFTDCLGKE